MPSARFIPFDGKELYPGGEIDVGVEVRDVDGVPRFRVAVTATAAEVASRQFGWSRGVLHAALESRALRSLQGRATLPMSDASNANPPLFCFTAGDLELLAEESADFEA